MHQSSEESDFARIAVKYVTSASLQDRNMFTDILDAKSSVDVERLAGFWLHTHSCLKSLGRTGNVTYACTRFQVRGWLMSGREAAEFEIPAASNVRDLHARFEELLNRRCHIVMPVSDGILNVSGLEGQTSLREALSESLRAWAAEMAWHQAAAEIVAAQLSRPSFRGSSHLQALQVPRVWETVLAMLSVRDDCEARFAFRLTVERWLEHKTFCAAVRRRIQLAQAQHLRCKGMYSEDIGRGAEKTVRKMEKMLQTDEWTESPERQAIERAAAIQAQLLKASPPQLEQASPFFCSELLPKHHLRSQLHWQAARLFESIGESREAAEDFQRSAAAGLELVAEWRDAAESLGAAQSHRTKSASIKCSPHPT